MSSLLPGVNSLLNPKSAILMHMVASNNRFSACKGLKIKGQTGVEGQETKTQRAKG